MLFENANVRAWRKNAGSTAKNMNYSSKVSSSLFCCCEETPHLNKAVYKEFNWVLAYSLRRWILYLHGRECGRESKIGPSMGFWNLRAHPKWQHLLVLPTFINWRPRIQMNEAMGDILTQPTTQRVRVGFRAPMSNRSQLPRTFAPKDPLSLASLGTPLPRYGRHAHIHMIKNKNKSLKNCRCKKVEG